MSPEASSPQSDKPKTTKDLSTPELVERAGVIAFDPLMPVEHRRQLLNNISRELLGRSAEMGDLRQEVAHIERKYLDGKLTPEDVEVWKSHKQTLEEFDNLFDRFTAILATPVEQDS